MSLRPLAILLVVQVALGIALLVWALQGFPLPWGGEGDRAAAGGGTTASAAERTRASRVNRVSGQRAFDFARFQVEEIGPRPAGSGASRRLARELRERLPRGRYAPFGDDGLRNVVGHIPGRRPAVLVAAHYDTEAEPEGHVGANDGAAGTALVVELARRLEQRRRPRGAREVRFVLFDGEEEPAGCADFASCGLRGSRAYAREHADEIGQMILLDYVGEKEGLSFPREGNSDPQLWARLRAAAQRSRVGELFPDRVAPYTILDDHVPFLQRGVPAIDLIDFDYAYRDTLDDSLDKISALSLDKVGEAVMTLVLELRRGR